MAGQGHAVCALYVVAADMRDRLLVEHRDRRD